ncbi:MAG: hypothetical protein E3J72_10690 [Planctomycetota bacterium]|nr:MAG: hypothetical protein E3J72_10690 [Planctomycetota bacterium]
MQQWIGVAALIIALFALLAMLLRTRRRIADLGSTYHDPDEDRTQTHTVRRELEQLLIDIEAMCRDITARLDTKIHVLNELLIEADDKINELEKVEPKSPPDAKTSEKSTSERKKPQAGPDVSSVVIPDSGEQVEPEPATEAKQDGTDKPLEDDPRFEKIFKLADSGTDLVSIARETGMPKGEIKLILGLRNRKKETREQGNKGTRE